LEVRGNETWKIPAVQGTLGKRESWRTGAEKGFFVKITVFGSGITFVLALMLGFISGNTLVTVFLRALVSALIFGVGSFFVTFLVRRFLPELLDVPASGRPASDLGGPEDSGEGNVQRTRQRVNILIQDEDGGVESLGQDDQEDGNLFTGDSSLSQVVEEVVEERVSAVSLGESLEHSGNSAEFFGDEGSDASGDNLPDIAGFESSFVSSTKENNDTEGTLEEGEPVSTNSGRSKRSGSAGLPETMDPQIIAKAISTALKKAT